MALSEAHREFLIAVRDKKSVMEVLRRHDIGYGWAIKEGYVIMHPAYFEFTLTPAGAAALSGSHQ